MTKDLQAAPLQESSPVHGFPVNETTDPADYLDTQTLAGGKDYFHTENAPTHRTDGKASGQSPETALTRASRSQPEQQGDVEDEYSSMTNPELRDLAEERGLNVEPRANKATLLEALRA